MIRRRRRRLTAAPAAATLVVTFVFLIAVGLWQGGPESANAYLGELFVFFVLVLDIFVNLANLVYHARFHRAVNDFSPGPKPAAPLPRAYGCVSLGSREAAPSSVRSPPCSVA